MNILSKFWIGNCLGYFSKNLGKFSYNHLVTLSDSDTINFFFPFLYLSFNPAPIAQPKLTEYEGKK